MLKINKINNELNFKSKNNDIIYEYDNNYIKMTLNKKKDFNNLDLDMIKSILQEIKKWNNNSVIFLNSSDKKAFCSGGDIKNVYLLAKNNEKLEKVVEFFRNEYYMNELISKFNIIPLIDGVCFGAGVSISINSKYKISTKNAKFAMPECKIGLFSGIFMKKIININLVKFFILTGYILKGKELKEFGVSDYFIPEWKKEYEIEIKKLSNDLEKIENYLKSISSKVDDEFRYKEQIDLYFKFETLEEIYDELNNNNKYPEFVKMCLNLMNNSSLLSQKISWEFLRRFKNKNSKEIFENVYIVIQNLILKNDFLEGIRCLFFDKEDKPNWKYKNCKEITKEIIDSHFIKKLNHSLFN